MEKKLEEIDKKTMLYEEKKAHLGMLEEKFSDTNFMKNSQNVIELNEKIDKTKKEITVLENELDELETQYLLMLEGEN